MKYQVCALIIPKDKPHPNVLLELHYEFDTLKQAEHYINDFNKDGLVEKFTVFETYE